MTNLEWLKKTINGKEGDLGFCAVLCEKVKNKSCDGVSCRNCDFNYFEKVIDYLLQEHKELIKLTQWEYDMIEITKQFNHDLIYLNENLYFQKLKEKGYFKNVDLRMTAKEVLENCEVVPNGYDYEF